MMRTPFREIAKLAALTLMRLSEIRLLRRDMLHLEQGVILVPTGQGGCQAGHSASNSTRTSFPAT